MSDKVIAVMNNPKNCNRCALVSRRNCRDKICGLSGMDVFDGNVRPDFCPLKPLPKFLSHEHVDYAHEASEIDGWNKCLESLLEDDCK